MNQTYQDYLAGFKPEAKPEAEWLRDFRLKAYGKFQQIGLPTRKTEAWKYMNLEPVLKTAFAKPELFRSGRETIDKHFFSEEKTFGRIVSVNGSFVPEYSRHAELGKGVRFRNIQAVLNEMSLRSHFFENLEQEENPFALVNAFSFDQGFLLHVPAGTVLEKPIHILMASLAEREQTPVFYPRVLVVLEEGAKADLVLDHADLGGGNYLMNSVVQVDLGRNAKLSFLNLQRQSEKAIQLTAHRIRLSEGSQFEGTSVTTGGASLRNDFQADFLAENASFSLNGLAVLGGNSQVFQHVTVHHRTPRNSSRQYFKNILSGQSQAEFSSLVHVWRGAIKSDSVQLDRNLLLSDTSRVWSRPQLKIDADDVKANHGAATGQLQENELFYLQSRGLDKNAAKTILNCGFAEELLNKIQPEWLRDLVEAPIREQIKKMVLSPGEGK